MLFTLIHAVVAKGIGNAENVSSLFYMGFSVCLNSDSWRKNRKAHIANHIVVKGKIIYN